MGRGWKIALGVVVVLISLLAINTLLVDAETESAEVTVPGGEILDLPGGEVQVVEGGPRDGSPIVLIHCFTVVGHSLGGAVTVALAEAAPELVDRAVIVGMPPDDSYGDLGFLASLVFLPVLGEALWTIKPDFSVRQGLEVAFAPGFDVPDAFVADVNRLTYTAYDESPPHTEDYLTEEPLERRLAVTGKPVMVLMGAEEQVVDDPRRALAQYRAGIPTAETRLIAGAGHSPNVEKPALSASLVLKFAK